MVANAFEVGDGESHLCDTVSLMSRHVKCTDFDEFLRNGMGEIVDGVFGIFDFSEFFFAWRKEAIDGGFEVFAGDVSHSCNFALGLLESDGGR